MRKLLALAPLLAALLTLAPAGPAHAQESAEQLYQDCLKQLRRGYYTKALEVCNRVRNFHRDDPVSVKAELAIADIYFKKGEWEQARLAYEDFARLHPRHPDIDYVTYRIGLSIYKRAPRWVGRDQTATRQAVNAWTGFRTRFPDSAYVDEVEELLQVSRERLALKELRIARFYMKRGSWRAVRMRAEALVRRFPDSEYVPEALFLAGRAYWEWGMEEQAKEVREVLADEHPDARALARLDRRLDAPPGEPPPEQIFIRPYRFPGMGAPAAQAMQ